MTKVEVSEIFSVMLLAWPSAEMFKGGISKLGPTIELWARCLSDVDFRVAQRATIRLCKESRFPPTIAEFREASSAVSAELDMALDVHWGAIKWELNHGASPRSLYGKMADMSRAIVDAMGGPDKLLLENGVLNYDGFRQAYLNLVLSEKKRAVGSGQAYIASGKN